MPGLGASALVVHSTVAKKLLFRHNMLLVDDLQPSSPALCLRLVFHWATQSRQLVADSTTLKNEPSLHLVACLALSCRGLDFTVPFFLPMAVNTARYKCQHVGVVLHFHCMHQFPACDGDADCLSEIKLRRFL